MHVSIPNSALFVRSWNALVRVSVCPWKTVCGREGCQALTPLPKLYNEKRFGVWVEGSQVRTVEPRNTVWERSHNELPFQTRDKWNWTLQPLNTSTTRQPLNPEPLPKTARAWNAEDESQNVQVAEVVPLHSGISKSGRIDGRFDTCCLKVETLKKCAWGTESVRRWGTATAGRRGSVRTRDHHSARKQLELC